jgi:hypothetical protein
MDSDQFRFRQVQIKKIEVDKWCAGCGMQRDPGSEYVLEWINRHAQWFRNQWEVSRCRRCSSWCNCGHFVREDCHTYQQL